MIFVNGRFLTQKITGVQRYGIEVLKELDKFVDKGELVVLMPPNSINELSLENIEIREIGKNSSNLWAQVTLPLYAFRHKGKILTMAGVCPIIKPDYVVVHDITFIRHPESFSRKFQLVYRLIQRLSLKRCKGIFTVSDFSKKEISNYYNIKSEDIQVAYPACSHLSSKHYQEESLEKWQLNPNEYFLSVSSQNAHKNQQYIYECAKEYPDKKFVIVGGNYQNSFKQMEEYECSNLIYTGYVSENELYTLYKNAYAFVFPSLYEGFGLPPLEAIMMGVKHIAVSDIEVFNEVYCKGVYYFEPHHPERFSIDELKNNEITPEYFNYYVNKFTWSNTARIIYDSIIK